MGDESYSYLQDHLGSPIRLMGKDADNIFAYDVFGKELSADTANPLDSSVNPFGFTRYQADSITDLYYAQARYYDSNTGRFNAEDIVNDGLNFYLYCSANPLGFVDKNGLWGKDIHDYITERAGSNLGLSEKIINLLIFHNRDTDLWYGDTSFLPVIGNQAYHFNRNTDEQADSRIELSQLHLYAAVNLVNGTGNLRPDLINYRRMLDALRDSDVNISRISDRVYDETVGILTHHRQRAEPMRLLPQRIVHEVINDPNLSEAARQVIALQHLGRGLHALQDIEAHGQIGAGPLNISGHTQESILSFLGWPVQNPDSHKYIWLFDDFHGRGTLAPMFLFGNFPGNFPEENGMPLFSYNSRILAAIISSEAFLQQFINAIDDSSWFMNNCPD